MNIDLLCLQHTFLRGVRFCSQRVSTEHAVTSLFEDVQDWHFLQNQSRSSKRGTMHFMSPLMKRGSIAMYRHQSMLKERRDEHMDRQKLLLFCESIGKGCRE